MNTFVLQCILGIALMTVKGTKGCRKELFYERLGRYPDSWRILRETTNQFFLAFYSVSSKTGSDQMCLHTKSRTLDPMKPWMSTLTYGHTLDNTTFASERFEIRRQTRCKRNNLHKFQQLHSHAFADTWIPSLG
uniref:Putative salivary lipocalin n=1 Tax=Ixodes ricinus TaxID=34613 RepID=A0A6B0URR9_IXORI